MNWGQWLVEKSCQAGSTVLAGCDYVGEGLASFLGITTPKYEFEVEEYKRVKALQEEETKNLASFAAHDMDNEENNNPETKQPCSSSVVTIPEKF